MVGVGYWVLGVEVPIPDTRYPVSGGGGPEPGAGCLVLGVGHWFLTNRIEHKTATHYRVVPGTPDWQ